MSRKLSILPFINGLSGSFVTYNGATNLQNEITTWLTALSMKLPPHPTDIEQFSLKALFEVVASPLPPGPPPIFNFHLEED